MRTIYVVTYYDFNHGPQRPNAEQYPLDKRFLASDRNYVYYLIDKKVPDLLIDKPTILEYDLDPTLHRAGGKYLAEWSFLLAEAKHSFATYPFFMISSRFYEKNRWLHKDLNEEWDTLFSYLERYQWGYLPSYDRPLTWVDLEWQKHVEGKRSRYMFFPFTAETYRLTEEVFETNIPNDYRYTPDLFCNYIGFSNRQSLLDYVNFYRPLLDFFFDENYELKRDLTPYVRAQGGYRNEKVFTFMLELLSHLFFFQSKNNYFALHYDGYHLIDEKSKKKQFLKRFKLPLKLRMYRYMKWKWRKSKTQGIAAFLKYQISKLKMERV